MIGPGHFPHSLSARPSGDVAEILSLNVLDTTIASYHNSMAKHQAEQVSVLIEKRDKIRARRKVDDQDNGHRISGMIEASQGCSDLNHTSTTSAIASSSVCTTASIDSRTKLVES